MQHSWNDLISDSLSPIVLLEIDVQDSLLWCDVVVDNEQFLRASAMLKHVIDIGWTSVCPSVCHTLALYQNG